METVQQELEVSLEHSLTQRLGKYWKLCTRRGEGERKESNVIQENLENTQDA